MNPKIWSNAPFETPPIYVAESHTSQKSMEMGYIGIIMVIFIKPSISNKRVN